LCELCVVAGADGGRLLKSGMASPVFLLTSVACNKADTSFMTGSVNNLYARIKQVDKNAAFEYSKIVKAIAKDKKSSCTI